MDTHDFKSLVIPLMVVLGSTILGVLVAVYLGFDWAVPPRAVTRSLTRGYKPLGSA